MIKNRLKILHAHLDDLESKEKRQIDNGTFEARDKEEDDEEGESFQSVFHVHCPRIYYTNRSRNVRPTLICYIGGRHADDRVDCLSVLVL